MTEAINPERHWLVIEDKGGRWEFALNEQMDMYRIGRHRSCELRLTPRLAFHRHYTVLVHRQEWNRNSFYELYTDIRHCTYDPRPNGVLINGQKILRHVLQDRDVITLSSGVRIVYRYELGADSHDRGDPHPPNAPVPRYPLPSPPSLSVEAEIPSPQDPRGYPFKGWS